MVVIPLYDIVMKEQRMRQWVPAFRHDKGEAAVDRFDEMLGLDKPACELIARRGSVCE